MFRHPLASPRPTLCFVLLLAFAGSLLGQSPALYSIDGVSGPPTDEETFYAELINRARANPPAEGQRFRNSTDPEIVAAIAFFRTDMTLVVQEFNAIPPAPPVALNGRLIDAARVHSRDQFQNQFQGHTGTDGSNPGSRVSRAGYQFSTTGENVYSSAKSVLHGHAGFEIDWGNDEGGLQTGRGHRTTIHNPAMRELGVGVVLGTNGSVGPQVVTQEFATQQRAQPLLTGVAYYDLSGDDFYTAGEGLGGIEVRVANASYYARTTPSGAFTVPMPGDGTYNVRFTGLGIDESGTVTVAGGRNVKLDLKRAAMTPVLAGPIAPAAAEAASYAFSAIPGATRYELIGFRIAAESPIERAEDASNVTLSVSSGYEVVQRAIRAEGSAAFNLRVLGGRTQTITFNRQYFARPGATLSFASRLAAATGDETARVQVSTDGGVTWQEVFSQAGSGAPGESAFRNVIRSLGPWENRVFNLRLVYSFTSGSYYNVGTAVGWYVDDIRLENCDELVADAPRDLGSATSFTFTPAVPGDGHVLRVNAYNNAHWLGSSTLRVVAGEGGSSAGAYLANLSVRSVAGTGAETLIVGFAISGGGKPLLVRGIGPALIPFGIDAALRDPRLEVYRDTTRVRSNDDWEASAATTFDAVGAFALPNGSRDSALVATLDGGSYTAQVTGAEGGTGIALVELYDAQRGGAARLVNVSARSRVGTGADLLVAGFNVAGTGSRRLLIRAIGPTLQDFGVDGALANPKLDLFRGGESSPFASNDDWQQSVQSSFGAVGAFPLPAGSRDSVLVVTLGPGSYTAQITGVNDTTGVALVEVYELP